MFKSSRDIRNGHDLDVPQLVGDLEGLGRQCSRTYRTFKCEKRSSRRAVQL
jgi:hypothetical protein